MQTPPLPVTFLQHRVFATPDVEHAPQIVSVSSTHQTDADDFRGLGFSDGSAKFYGSHWVFCCNNASGTDRWFFKLQNGWTIPAVNVVNVYAPQTGAQISPDTFTIGTQDKEWFSCGYFS